MRISYWRFEFWRPTNGPRGEHEGRGTQTVSETDRRIHEEDLRRPQGPLFHRVLRPEYGDLKDLEPEYGEVTGQLRHPKNYNYRTSRKGQQESSSQPGLMDRTVMTLS